MDYFSAETLRTIILFVPILILSLSIHEAAHAWTADKLGDSTSRYLGRLTLNPLAHISWIGTVLFPIVALLTHAPLFGWANPVPVNTRNLRDPEKGMAIVALAGPVSNIILTFFFAMLFSIFYHWQEPVFQVLGKGNFGAAIQMFSLAIELNLFLAFFNLIPIPPLDGSRIVAGYGPRSWAIFLQKYGFQLQILLLVAFLFGYIRFLAAPVMLVKIWIFELFGVPTA